MFCAPTVLGRMETLEEMLDCGADGFPCNIFVGVLRNLQVYLVHEVLAVHVGPRELHRLVRKPCVQRCIIDADRTSVEANESHDCVGSFSGVALFERTFIRVRVLRLLQSREQDVIPAFRNSYREYRHIYCCLTVSLKMLGDNFTRCDFGDGAVPRNVCSHQ